MAESKATVPEFAISTTIDMEGCVGLRGQLKAVAPEGGAVPSYNDMVVKACALALREFPRANGSYKDGRFELYSRVNVGVAVAADDALVVPTIFDADRKAVSEIARESRALAERVRAGVVTPPELGGGTFTVSNLGMFGVTSFQAVINPPQAAILAVGAMEQRAVVRDGEIVARNVMDVTLVCDHRILYGADAARVPGPHPRAARAAARAGVLARVARCEQRRLGTVPATASAAWPGAAATASAAWSTAPAAGAGTGAGAGCGTTSGTAGATGADGSGDPAGGALAAGAGEDVAADGVEAGAGVRRDRARRTARRGCHGACVAARDAARTRRGARRRAARGARPRARGPGPARRRPARARRAARAGRRRCRRCPASRGTPRPR